MTFTASNGAQVTATDYGTFKTLRSETVDNSVELAGVHTDALREFFQHERDEELSRWRWNSEYVVREIDRDAFDRRRVEVLNERTFERTTFNPTVATGASQKHQAARAYFQAHPERKPWHDAKPGEVWELTYGGRPTAHVYTDRHSDHMGMAFVADRAIVNADDPDITAGHRVWPES